MAILSLCACSSSGDNEDTKETKNYFQYGSEEYIIAKAVLSSNSLRLVSGETVFEVYNVNLVVGHKTYLSETNAAAVLGTSVDDGWSGEIIYQWGTLSNSSYVSIMKEESSNRYNVYVSDGKNIFRANYLGVTSQEDNNLPPTQNEGERLLNTIKGDHTCGVLFPEIESDKIKKDSIGNLPCNISISDEKGILSINKFPVKYLAKCIKDETISKEVAALSEQELTIQIIPYSVSQQMFLTVANDITYKDANGKQVNIQFYGGATNYSVGAITTRKDNGKKSFSLYLTPGRVLVDGKEKDALRKINSSPYVILLEVTL